MSTTTNPVEAKTPVEPTDRIGPDLRKFLERAQSGDESTLPAIQEMLKLPRIVELFGGNLAKSAETAFIKARAGKNLAVKEAITRQLELMRDELAGPNPTPVERLLVERIVACWLQVQDADIRFAHCQGQSTAEQAEYAQRRMNHSHKRYLSALKTLAQVRKLAVPVLQVNIAKKQVNVAGGCMPDQGKDE